MHINIAKIDFNEFNKTKIYIAKIDFAKKLVEPVPEFDYMYFKLADGYTSGNVSYSFYEYYDLHNKYLKISTDGRHWKDWTEAISMTQNTKYFVKGEDSYVRNSNIIGGFFSSDVSKNTFNIECGGNVMSLCNLATEINTNYCFCSLFYNMKNLLTTPALPATTLANRCYDSMFYGCSSLTQAPTLPATTLAYGCYWCMFRGCSKLTQSPALPATTLANNCYQDMFSGCNSLTQAPELPLTTLAEGCYSYMFSDCSSLTQAPELPATTLKPSCYSYMFYGCSSLVSAPELLATTLANNCYSGMFQGCTSLNKAPALPATTLAYGCYSGMFQGCTSLTEITLNGDFNSSYATDWVRNVSSSGTFYNNSDVDIPVGVNGIPTGWTEIRPVKVDYMYFKLADGAESGNVSYKFDEYYNLHNKYLKISTDGSNWSDWTEQISMTPNTKYFVNGEDSYVRNSNKNVGFFTSDVNASKFNIECGGNIMSLCNNATEITTNYCLKSLFNGMTNLHTAPKLPATTLVEDCYDSMFFGCSSLTQAPALPATKLAYGCYSGMFYGCTSLTQAPELPATTLAKSCYSSMFYGCSKLTQAPELPATRLENYCYSHMFDSCRSLTQAPELPATTLANYCYYYMFYQCYSLTQAPALPATTLENYCYQYMFGRCSSLVKAPELPATTLADYCYSYMFDSCSSLTQAPSILPATTLGIECYSNMFLDCTSLTQAPELPATRLEIRCYNGMFYRSNKLNWIKALFTTTPSTSYTNSWVNGVSAQGVFVKNINATWTDTSAHAVPPEWQIIYYDKTENKYYTTQTKEVECDKYGNPLGAARMKLFTRKPTDVGIFWDPEAELFDSDSDYSYIEGSEYMSE